MSGARLIKSGNLGEGTCVDLDAELGKMARGFAELDKWPAADDGDALLCEEADSHRLSLFDASFNDL